VNLLHSRANWFNLGSENATYNNIEVFELETGTEEITLRDGSVNQQI